MILSSALVQAACATRSPDRQSYVEVNSANFEVLSSLGDEETRDLVRDLEFFHAGTLAVFGMEESPGRHGRTRVLAFDDRSPGRPFAIRGEPAYYLPGVDSGVIVLRVPDAWGRQGALPMRAAYAHRLLRSRSPIRLPLWLEEGLAEAASAIQIRDDEIRMGALIEPYVAEIKDWRRSSLASILQEDDLSEDSDSAREQFAALSWGLVHTLMYPVQPVAGGTGFPAKYLAVLESPGSRGGRRAADASLGGDAAELASRVHEHFQQSRFALQLMRPQGWDPDALELRAVSSARISVALGELALALDRSRLAARLFERANRDEPDDSRALAGLALARVDDFEAGEALARRALAGKVRDVQVPLLVGRMYAEAAAVDQDPEQRSRKLEQARENFRACLELDASLAQPRLDLALSYFIAGEDPADGVEWLESAASLRPGSLEIDLGRARLQASRGNRRAAIHRARAVISRSQWDPLRDEARELIEELEDPGR
jgi:tetratricopeptide (TPR) repeat protein